MKLQMCHHFYQYKSIFLVRDACTPGTPPGAATEFTQSGSARAVWFKDEFPQKSTTYHNLPPEGTDCTVCSQNWRTNSCAFLCNMFDLYHAQSSSRYFDRKYFNRRMRFLFAKLVLCVPPFYREYTHIAPRQNSKMAAHTRQAWRIKNTSSD